jgi:hypothetical protein
MGTEFKPGLLVSRQRNTLRFLMFMIPYILVTYIFDCKSNEMHTEFLCILYYTILALHVSGAIYTHHQEHKLQSTAIGTRDCYGVLEVG